MKTLGQITLFAIMIVSALLTAFLGVHVLLSVAILYSLPFISTLSFSQAYGFWTIVNLLQYNLKKSEVKNESDNVYVKAFTGLATTILVYLLFWGSASVIFNILN